MKKPSYILAAILCVLVMALVRHSTLRSQDVPNRGLTDQIAGHENRDAEKRIEVPEALKEFYLRLFSALRERDIQLCPRLFGKFEIHQVVYAKVRAEGAIERSWELAQHDYLNDCKRVMDQLPKTGRSLGVLEFDVSKAREERVGNITVVKGIVLRCGYGSGGVASLTLSPPPVANVAGKWYFLDRFEELVRFQYLDPETGE